MADRQGHRRTFDPLAAALVVAVSACASGGPAAIPPESQAVVAPAPEPGPAPVVAAAPPKPAPRPKPRPHIRWADSTVLERAVTTRLGYEPLAQVLARRTRQPELADRAAAAVVRESRRLNLSPSLLAAVLLIENRALDTAAVSSQGAVGLMQVMPVHAGSYGCASTDLKELDANICHGARLLRLYVVRNRTLRLALRRYNGCVRGTVTPRCSRYPARVLATAGSVRREMLRIAAQDGMIVGMAGRRID
ncbi:MAG TPA: lytic transglycosylase domain-containing protein [Gemmatimonadales bacterium]|jgi:soluble lytic murein transglycosylase-like protein|nr:lytic transglycosylase domain-containing protein [Gemmatimonadales bacterium]